jgi:hypothetical protein
MNDGSDWSPMDLNHPSTFDTLAMERTLKRSVIDDLDKFIKRKAYFKKIGKAWKRGYLLHGPPGTGKSSLIAAMANHLRFDIYDLELTGVHTNSDLRKLLIGIVESTGSISISLSHKYELGDAYYLDPEIQPSPFLLLHHLQLIRWQCCVLPSASVLSLIGSLVERERVE